MISHESIEEFICQFPVYQYAFFKPEDIEFSFRVRWICEQECEQSTTQPGHARPAVGSVEECRKRCLEYEECFLFSTIAEVSDVINFEETLATRAEHEEITAAVERFIREQGAQCMALSTESCDICENCALSGWCLRIFQRKCTPVWKAMKSLSVNWQKNMIWSLH